MWEESVRFTAESVPDPLGSFGKVTVLSQLVFVSGTSAEKETLSAETRGMMNDVRHREAPTMMRGKRRGRVSILVREILVNPLTLRKSCGGPSVFFGETPHPLPQVWVLAERGDL
jgi:hypothetical protein